MSPADRRETNPVWTFMRTSGELVLPDFTAFSPDALSDACTRAIDDQQSHIASLLSSAEEPRFENTTLQIGWARYMPARLSAIIRVLQANTQTDELAPVLAEATARLTQARLALLLDPGVFSRLEAVGTEELNPEDRRYHRLLVEEFVRAGARLDDESRARAAALAAEIDRLSTEFARMLPAEARRRALHVTDPGLLAGLGDSAVAAGEARASEAGVEGHLLALGNTTQQAELAHLEDPRARDALLAASLARGTDGPGDTREIVSDITALRAALADVLGFRSYASFAIDDQTAGSPDTAGDLLGELWPAAEARFAAELADIRSRFQPERLAAGDVTYWLHRRLTDAVGIDDAELEQYFEFERVLADGVFYAATILYGIRFREQPSATAWHPDVRVFEALEDDTVIGLVCLDPFARPGKSGGAWMDELVSPGRFTGDRPIVTMSLTLERPAAVAPVLLSIDEVVTVFHEFGHVLHALVSTSTYPSQSGTSVPRDYVEFPSQLNEMWAFHPHVLPNYAVHATTGEDLPDEVADRIRAGLLSGQGFATAEYIAAAFLDLGWHSLQAGEQIEEVLVFESEVLAAAGIDELVPPRYRSTYFHHIFGNDYAAGYYAYLWSDVIAARAADWFESRGGLDPEAGQEFRETILAPGNSVDPMSAVEKLFGAVPTSEALKRRRGLGSPN